MNNDLKSGLSIGFMVGSTISTDTINMEKAAIEAGAAYYHPATGKFTFGMNGPTVAD
jgi:hypothetical protein